MLTKPPYVVKSEGWGEFEIGVQVVFKYGLGEWGGHKRFIHTLHPPIYTNTTHTHTQSN